MATNERLNQMKCEIAAEFGIPDYDNIDKGELSSRINGKIGGEMVRRLIEIGKKQLTMEQHRELIPIPIQAQVKKEERVLRLPLPLDYEGNYNPRRIYTRYR